MGFSRYRTTAFQGLLTVGVALGVGCAAHSKRVAEAVPVAVNGEPMLLGRMTQQSLFRHFEVFKEAFDDYVPPDLAIATVRGFSNPLEIRIFLGTWCIDSKHHLPAFLKIMDKAHNPNIKLTLFGLDRSKRDPGGIAAQHAITRVPTMIFYVNGVEIGRMTERPHQTVEQDIVAILDKAGP